MGGRPPSPSLQTRRQGLTTGVVGGATPGAVETPESKKERERAAAAEEAARQDAELARQQRNWEALHGGRRRGRSNFARPPSPVQLDAERRRRTAEEEAATAIPDAPPPPPDMADVVNARSNALMRPRTKRGVRSTFLTGPHGTASRTFLGGL